MQHIISLERRQEMKATDQATRRQKSMRWQHAEWLALPLALVALVLVWQALVMLLKYEAFILPSPTLVAERFVATLSSGLLWDHITTTLFAALGGFALALVASVLLGYVLANIPLLERTVAPVLASIQAVPIVAIAPLIVLWLGTGIESKVFVAALITFLPMLINTIVALHHVPQELREMAIISGANRWQMLWYVEIPLSLPVFLGGVRTGVSLATTGAVVGEFVAGRDGLGALINIARGLFDTPLIFVALVTLVLITLVFNMIVSFLERRLVQWNT